MYIFLKYTLGLFLVAMTARGQDFSPESVSNTVVEFDVSLPFGGTVSSTKLLSSDGATYFLQTVDRVLGVEGRYTWQKTGAATGALVLDNGQSRSEIVVTFSRPNRGTYRTGQVTNTISFLPYTHRTNVPLRNVSTRVLLLSNQPAIVGFVVAGATPKRVLIRAIGPSLSQFGISDAAATPVLTLFKGTTQTASNVSWGGAPSLAAVFAKVGAFALPDASRDAAILMMLEPGNYTAQVRSEGGGEVLLEVYFVDP